MAIGVVLAGALAVLVRPDLLRDRVERASGLLVFQGRDDTGYGIFTMDLGSGRHPPPAGPDPIGRSGFPRYSPDGGRLAFVAASDDGIEDLYIADPDGSNPRVVAASPGEPEGAPAWSPDGSTIAFSSRRDGNWEIYTVRPDGTDLRRLTRNEAFDAAPAWSPDGSGTIAFASDRGGVDSHLYLMADDGSGVRRLTSGDDEGVTGLVARRAAHRLRGLLERERRHLDDRGRRLRRPTPDAERDLRVHAAMVAGRPLDRVRGIPRATPRTSSSCVPTEARAGA